MQSILRKQYIRQLLPAVCLFTALGLVRYSDLIMPGQFAVPSVIHTVMLVLSAMTAVAGPLFFRTLFAHTMRAEQAVPENRFLLFQKKILRVSLLTPYFAFIAVLCDFPRFFSAAIVLLALYAVYYYYPSAGRIQFDARIFRVKVF